MRRIILGVAVCFVFCLPGKAQEIRMVDSADSISFRGLSVVSNNIIWVSGSKGTIARSVDGGNSFVRAKVSGFEDRDFRDVEAFDSNTAVIMAVSEPALILKTIDGGTSWSTVFFDTTKGMFLDAMSFDKAGNGVVIGDPINGSLFMAVTKDYGSHWQTGTLNQTLKKGEAFFAASGSNLTVNPLTFVSGGTVSNFYASNLIVPLPINQGKETTGANSISSFDSNNIVVVGGDFSQPNDTIPNCALSFNAGKTWIHPQVSPHGYRSCVIHISSDTLLTCGINGVDISTDKGLHWKQISNMGFHVCQKAKKGNAVFLAGANGKIARLIL